MNHAELAGGFIAATPDDLTLTPPTAKGGKGGKKAKVTDLNKKLDAYGLSIAADYFNQAIINIQQAKKIIDKLADRIDYDLTKAVD